MAKKAASKNKKPRIHKPNHIPKEQRTKYILFSVGLLIYGTIGVYIDDIYLPGKRGPGVHFHGLPCWALYLAFLCAIANMISVVVDHYDKRNNEIHYDRLAKWTFRGGWIFFVLAVLLEIVYVSHYGVESLHKGWI